MREIEVTLGSKTLTLVASFKASVDIATKVADPLAIAREAAIEAELGKKGIVYEPKWRFTTQNIPVILHIGAKAAGSEITLEEMQELVFEGGFFEAREAASEYLARIVEPKSVEVDAKKGKAKAGE